MKIQKLSFQGQETEMFHSLLCVIFTLFNSTLFCQLLYSLLLNIWKGNWNF